MRLTKKVKRTPIYDCDYESRVEEKGLLDKLGQLEDIEEELGIDLITIIKALTNGIYEYIDYDDSSYSWIGHTEVYFDGKQFIRKDDKTTLDLSMYKKHQIEGWALTKEELK